MIAKCIMHNKTAEAAPGLGEVQGVGGELRDAGGGHAHRELGGDAAVGGVLAAQHRQLPDVLLLVQLLAARGGGGAAAGVAHREHLVTRARHPPRSAGALHSDNKQESRQDVSSSSYFALPRPH